VSWLTAKVAQTKAALVTCQSGTFTAMADVPVTAYAVGLLSEYLSVAWEERLTAALALPEEVDVGVVLHADPVHPRIESDAKRQRLDPKAAAKAKAAEQRQATKTAKLAKEAAGMRTMSSFFGGKSKGK
jgi:hypothetical protein